MFATFSFRSSETSIEVSNHSTILSQESIGSMFICRNNQVHRTMPRTDCKNANVSWWYFFKFHAHPVRYFGFQKTWRIPIFSTKKICTPPIQPSPETFWTIWGCPEVYFYIPQLILKQLCQYLVLIFLNRKKTFQKWPKKAIFHKFLPPPLLKYTHFGTICLERKKSKLWNIHYRF